MKIIPNLNLVIFLVLWFHTLMLQLAFGAQYYTNTTYTGASTANIGDHGSATSAYFSSVSQLFGDSMGNLYVTDGTSCTIRMVDSTTQIITTIIGIAGQCNSSYIPVGGPIEAVNGIGGDSAGNLYFTQGMGSNPHVVLKYTATTKVTSVFAGKIGAHGSATNNVAATSTQLYLPSGVFCDTFHGLLYLSDTGKCTSHHTETCFD